MIEHPDHPKGAFHMDDNLYKNIVPLKKRILKHKDAAGLICGEPGNGKSTIGSQICYVLDPTIKYREFVYTKATEYIIASNTIGEKGKSTGKAIMHDEGRDLGGTNVLKKEIKTFWDYVYENRFLEMVQLWVHSDFFMTPVDVINMRARFLIWVVEDDDWNNGTFYFFGRGDMKRLYFNGKKSMDRTPRGYSFKGRFVNYWAGKKDYEQKKAERFFNKYRQSKITFNPSVKDLVKIILKRNPNVKPIDAIKVLNVDRSYFFAIKKELESGK